MASKKSRSGETQKAPIEAERHFLLKLSDCCAQHAESHPSKPLQPLTEQDEIPERCQREMSSLCKILPRVEDAYGIDKNPHPSYLTHLCDFYQSVIQGRFCPHAPLLLEWGKNGTAVLPRIFSLYQHLVSKAILSNVTSVLKTEESPPVADTICTTLTEMMNFIPSQRLQECLVRDLIHLAFDLAVIADILEQENSVQVSILEETSAECKLTEMCLLTFSNIDSLHVTWSATLEILGSLLKLQRNKRLQSTYDETAESYSIMNLPTVHADLVWSSILDDGEMLSTALVSMRKVLLSTPPNAKPVLVTRTKVSAAKLLGNLLEDWKASSIVQLPGVTEATLIVARAVRVHLSRRAQDEHLPTKDDLQMSSLCVTLLCDAVIFPPTTLGSDSNTAVIRAASFIELLNCIPLITAVAKEAPFVKDDVILAHVVLRAIHATLFTQSDDGTYPMIATAVNHCALEGIFPAVFQLLENAHLANVATQILSAMLSAGTDTSVDIASACRLAQNSYEKEIANGQAAPELTSPRSGSKRRGRSSQTSPYRPQQLQLRLERSPKRSRIGLATNSQATLATPSPPSLSHSGGLAATGNSKASLNGKGCHESLRSTLLRALLNAKHIVGMVDPCRALFEAGKPSPTSSEESADEISKAIISVSTGLCLLFRLIPNECHEGVDEKVKALLQVASLLAKSLTSVAMSLASHYKTSNGTLSDATDRAVKCVSRVGLEGQFTVNRTVASFPKIHRDTITDCLDAFSVCAREVWTIQLRSPEAEAAEMALDRVESNKSKSRTCDGTCHKVMRTLSSDRGRDDNYWLPCLCKLLRLPDTLPRQRPSSSDRGEMFQSDCIAVLLERLSTCDRCAIFCCLRPTTKEEDMSNNIGKHPMGQLFSGSLLREPQTMHTVLSLSPLFVVSAVLAVLKKDDSSEFMLDAFDEMNGGSTASSSPTGRDLVRQLSSHLGRLLYGKYLDAISKSSALTEAAYLAVGRIHELCDVTLRVARDSSESSPDTMGPFLQEVLLNPLSLIAFILDCRFAPELTAQNGGSSRRLRDSLYDAVEETYRARRTALLSTCATGLNDNLLSEARIIKWRSLADTCRRSTVSEMAQLRSRPNRTKVDDGVGFEVDESTDDGISTQNPLVWLLRSAFADESFSFRFEAARNIGRVLQENKSSLMYAVFSTPSNWRRQDSDTRTSSCSDESRQCASLEHVVIPLFLEIDRLLCRYCCVPQSQLSFTMGPSVISDKASALTSRESPSTLLFQRSAIVALSSLCEYADVESPCGLLVFEHAFTRLIRLWTAAIDSESQDSSVDLLDSVSISALAFAEMDRLNKIRDLRSILLLKHSYDRFVPRLFLDILLPSTEMLSSTGTTERPGVLERENRERQFRLLQTFIGSFLSASPETLACQIKTATLNGSYCMHGVWEFVEAALPSVMSAYIMAKDHDSLLIIIAFKLFLLGEKRKIEKAAKKAIRPGSIHRDETIGSAPRAIMHKIAGIDTSTKDLVEQTKLQCLAPDTIELILPRILMANDSSQLLFFLEVVLQKKCSLQHMISTRHKLILKTIVSEFGRTGDVSGAEHALRTAAKARDSACMSEMPGSSSSKQAEENEVVCRWVSSSFMYLLVNVVQHHWKSRTLLERTRALRSLKWIIKFLSPSDAPQYLPQVMATVNMAMSGECSPSETHSSTWQLRLLAIQSLSEFIRTAIRSQYETVGSNLATIVVSLFPVLAADPGAMFSNDEMSAFNEASKVAVDLLEWLTQGDNGKNLALYFGDVPFLPPTKALDKVRDGLKLHGVSFDNLHVFSSTQNTQHTMSVRGSLTSEGASYEEDRKEAHQSYSSSAQAALRRRLHVVRKLLSHENASVRRAVLQHLIDLLRANRGLFNRLIDGEERSSLNRFVTVSLGPDAINGCVTSIVDALLQRCCSEIDFETKQWLASCLGEVGAIGAHRLGEMKVDPLLTKASDDSGLWRLKQAPWQSRPVRYELKVVTNHLVVALKAAPSSGDQHKIAFAIQQLLVLLDEHAKMSSRTESKPLDVRQVIERSSRGIMSDWLREQLSEAGVIETIEPFWFSNFKETEAFSTKEPPFFQGASSYFGWLSYWCRYMLKRSNDDGQNQWCSFFYACRTAIRSKAGMSLAEFIIPLLVLDRICNGNGNDESTVINEFLSVFDFSDMDNKEGHGSSKMNQSERQKAVNCAFMVLDRLQHWAEKETEERYHSSRSTSVARLEQRKANDNATESTCWLWEESVSAIDRLLKAVPLSLQANAAAAVGMHARALRLMEMAARADVVQNVYDSLVDLSADTKSTRNDRSPGGQKLGTTHAIGSVDSIDTSLLKKVLGQLNDCDTMEGIANMYNTASSALDDILIKEAKGEWSGALYDYERALELNEATKIRPKLEEGSLRCLLELGQLESVLHQVNGIVHCQQHGEDTFENDSVCVASMNDSQATPFAVEAAWRLGRWSTLTKMLNDIDSQDMNRRGVDSDGLYRVSLGNAMQGLYERSKPKVISSMRNARHVLMSDLANVASESYSRSYPYLVRLHCLREIENACEVMCCEEGMNGPPRIGELASSRGLDGWDWNGRLAVIANAGSSEIIDVRLALSRLAGDVEVEGSLYLMVGKKARKNGLVNIAANFLSQAEACCSRQRSGMNETSAATSHVDDLLSSIRLQLAKLKHQSGESTAALRILGLENVSGMLQNDDKTLQSLALSYERNAITDHAINDRDQAADINRFSRRLLQSTRWIVEGGIKGGSEVIERFRIVQKLSPHWEKGFFQFAKYIDGALESKISTLAYRLGKSRQLSADDDAIKQDVIVRDKSSVKYLLLAMEQYISALKYSSKHVYQALPRLLSLWFDFTAYNAIDTTERQTNRSQCNGEALAYSQAEANDLVSKNLRTIPAHCYYTALSQLISRIGHPNAETVQVVKAILTRVLTKHPEQAMWSLAWLLHSADKERADTGDEIFKDAQTSLSKRKEPKLRSLLSSSRTLFRYFIDIAKYEPKEGCMRAFTIKTWRGEADLSEFVPPVQEALSVSPMAADNGNAVDAFPAMVPRMRAFCSKVHIMASKAKPKKAKAFVVPADQPRSRLAVSSSNNNKEAMPGDIGEMHFLVKREAKGDLRKDSRIQNLNSVINRLLAASSNNSGTLGASRQQRRLHLRTFAVTCLSEDCGILEWVPNTDSLRNLVMHSYNPQASPFSIKRRGRRIGNYGDSMSLKGGFEKCQSLFFKNGNLHQAAAMFEQICLKPYPPLLYWYFVQHFMDPHSWYEARTQFTLSCAAWSAVGHVIGLGDRHAENILVDTASGQCVHVDFDCIFDKGLNLPKPEIVPFRLSPNMIDAFGPIGADGVYTGGLKAAMTTLRDNRDTLLSVLEPFIKDPIIDWKRQKSSQRTSKTSASELRSLQAKRSITTIDERLKGIYNLHNPNFKKVKRTDGWSQDVDDEMMNMLPLSVEGQVHKMITEATSHENLVQLYVGWMPWV